MSKKCFIDKRIELTKCDIDFITAMNLDAIIYDEKTTNCKEIEYLLLHSKLSDDQLLEMQSCKYIGIRAHNTDYVNKRITEKQKIVIKGLQNQHGVNAVAEHTFSLILSLTKNLVKSHENVVQGKWRENLRLNYELNKKKLGIVGNGQIGRRVAELGKAFGMEILIAGKKSGIKSGEMSLEDVLKNCDVISLHLSSKKENDKYINHECLKLMKKNAILINTSRGSVLDYVALESELEKDKFLGVGLDVFDTEPLQNSHLTEYSNVILTPHVAYMTNETLDKMNNELLANLKEFIN
jgi:lactate dehydrogenase-like 2-hydroxyacid dehydrogenase